MTQAEIDNAINQVVNNFTGQRIAMPNGQYMGECTAPITWYLQYLGLPWNMGMHNSRADGWGVVHPHELTPYFTFENFQQGKAYPRGSILMWNSPHIAIVLNDAGGDNVVICFEQNADPDGAACGTHTRTLNTSTHTCTYAMIPIVPVQAPAPPPAPTPPPQPSAPPSAPVPVPVADVRYEVVVPLQGYTNATSAGNHAGLASPVPEGEYYIFRTYPGKDYLKNISKIKGQPGWWVNGNDNVVPEPEPAPAPPPPPVSTNGSVGPREATPPETPPPAPVPEPTPVVDTPHEWETSYSPYKEKEHYKAAHTYITADLSHQEPDLTLPEGQGVYVYGTFSVDGVKYYRLRHPEDTDFKLWYGVPILHPATGMPVLLSDPKIKRRPALHNAPSTGTILKDTTHLLTARIEEDAMQFLDMVPHWFTKSKKYKKGQK